MAEGGRGGGDGRTATGTEDDQPFTQRNERCALILFPLPNLHADCASLHGHGQQRGGRRLDGRSSAQRRPRWPAFFFFLPNHSTLAAGSALQHAQRSRMHVLHSRRRRMCQPSGATGRRRSVLLGALGASASTVLLRRGSPQQHVSRQVGLLHDAVEEATELSVAVDLGPLEGCAEEYSWNGSLPSSL